MSVSIDGFLNDLKLNPKTSDYDNLEQICSTLEDNLSSMGDREKILSLMGSVNKLQNLVKVVLVGGNSSLEERCCEISDAADERIKVLREAEDVFVEYDEEHKKAYGQKVSAEEVTKYNHAITKSPGLIITWMDETNRKIAELKDIGK